MCKCWHDIGGTLRRPEGPRAPQFDAYLALEPQQTADANVTAREAADLLRPGIPNAAQTSTYVTLVYEA